MSSAARGLLLVTAADAGAANFLSPVLPLVSRPYLLLSQEPASSILERRGLRPKRLERSTPFSSLQREISDLIRHERPAAVVVGTSWGPTLDRAAVLSARETGVQCAALVDHWSHFAERFSSIEDGVVHAPLAFLPDQVWVIDELAITGSTQAGIPAPRLRSVGHPFLEARRVELGRQLEGAKRTQETLFVSERIRADFPRGSTLDRGYDEFEALNGLLEALGPSPRLLIKLHPQDEPGKYDKQIDGRPGVRVIREGNLDDLLVSSHRVVGMESMLLLEASLVRSDVISFLPGTKANFFVGNRVGATTPASSISQLRSLLQNTPTSGTVPFGESFVGSASRLARMVETLSTGAS